MLALLVFIAVAALSLLASSRAVLDPERSPTLALLAAGGLPFLVAGAVLGPGLLGVVRADNVASARPLEVLALGAVGMLLGLNVEPRLLRRLPAAVMRAGAVHALAAFVVVALVSTPLLQWLGLALRDAATGGVLLGAAASVSSGHLAVLRVRHGQLARTRGLSLNLLTVLDDGVGLLLLALALVLGSPGQVQDAVAGVALSPLLGLVCGALLAFLAAGLAEGELTAVLLGGVALVSGAAGYLRTSTLLAGVACGAALSLVGGAAASRLATSLARFERPTYLVLLFLAGCHLQARDPWAWALMPAFVAVRLVGKALGGAAAARLARGVLDLPPRPGLALVAQGGLAVGVVLEYLLLVPGPASQLLFDVAVLGALANEVLAVRVFPSEPRRRGVAAGAPPAPEAAP